MRRKPILAIMCCSALAGCAAAVEPVAIYGTTAAVANPPDENTAGKIGANVQAGAAEAQDHMDTFGGALKDGIYETTDHIAGWMEPSTPKPAKSIAASYCYHVYQDILCYRQPMPGWEDRIAGYQPLNAPPPPPAMMQPLPKHAADNSQLPVNRVASSKPVFNQLPAPLETQKAPEDGTTPAAAAPDATHEQLPNPAMAPQL